MDRLLDATRGLVMGDHRKPDPDPSQGRPLPGNADGKVEPPPSGGKHKKD